MKVTTAAACSSAAGGCGGSTMRAGQRARRSMNNRGNAENGCPAAPVELKNRVPSK
jgi:hypothetical protein